MSVGVAFSGRLVANVFAVAAADDCSQRAELTGAAHIRSPLNSASGVPRSAQCSGFACTASAHSLRQRDHFSRTRRATRVRTRMLLALRMLRHSTTPAVCSPPFALPLLRLPGSSLAARHHTSAANTAHPLSILRSVSALACCATPQLVQCAHLPSLSLSCAS